MKASMTNFVGLTLLFGAVFATAIVAVPDDGPQSAESQPIAEQISSEHRVKCAGDETEKLDRSECAVARNTEATRS
jgi:cytochrome c-type biogenesis protein CcmH/NrfF